MAERVLDLMTCAYFVVAYLQTFLLVTFVNKKLIYEKKNLREEFLGQ